jgi:superfamily II DNA/RNA helicase
MVSDTLAGTKAGRVEVSPSETSPIFPAFAGNQSNEKLGLETATAAAVPIPGGIPPIFRTSGSMDEAGPDLRTACADECEKNLENNPPDGCDPATSCSSGDDANLQSNPAENSFLGLGLSSDVLKAVAESGYVTPTPIQTQGIPPVLQRRDIIGIAQTGTGKTASFTLPMIELLARGRAKARMPRSLILEPTRELAAQVAESFERYGKYNKLSMALLIGGTSFDDQDRKLDRGVDVLIATPGRLLDHFERGKLMLSQVQILVVDEADRMLDMGFIPDVERICKLIPFTRQTLFYSATMPPEIRRLTDQFLHNPVRVEVARPATIAENITQEAVDVPANDWAKREALRRLIRSNNVKNAIVFCNRKRDVDVVAKSLSKHGFNAAPLHGDLDQSLRMRTLDGFRSGAVQLLVASDVAARGLDIPNVSHIFNFDVPYHPDDYVHRIGRTGRAGRSGHAFMLVTARDAKYLEAIEALINKSLPRCTVGGLAEAVQDRPHDSRGRGRHRHDRRGHRPERHTNTNGVQPTAPEAGAPPPLQARPAHPRPAQHVPQQQSKSHEATPLSQPKSQSSPAGQVKEPGADALKLPAFLLRPIPLPKTEKPVRGKRRVAAEA